MQSDRKADPRQAGSYHPVARGHVAALFAFAFLVGVVPAQAQPAPGEWVKVRGPITSEKVKQITNQTNQALARGARIIVYEFEFGDVSEYGECRNLEKFILDEIQGRAETYAYIEKPLKGHAVLPALACQFLFMGPEAAIGDVTFRRENRSIDQAERVDYVHVADRRGKEPPLVLKMLDRKLSVYQIDSAAGGRKYKLFGDLTAEDRNSQPKQIKREGEVGLYTTKEALEHGLCSKQFGSAQEVAEFLQLPGSLIQGDPLEGQAPVAGLIVISGDITGATTETVRRQIGRALNKGINTLVFQIHGSGVDAEAAATIAEDIRSVSAGQFTGHEGKRARTIAYIPERTAGAATFVALGCNQIVMGANGELGDCAELVYAPKQGRGPRERLPDEKIKDARDRLVLLAQKQGYPPILFQGLLDLDVVIVPVQSKPDVNQRVRKTFLSEGDADRDKHLWDKGQPIKKAGELLKFSADDALRWGIARGQKVENLEGLAAQVGFEPGAITRIGNDWLDKLVEVLRHPAATVFLVMVGFTCLILEFKTPGVGLPLISALVCFLLVFWSHSWVSGEVNALAILIFLLGLILLGVELFLLPGFGIWGISGIVLLLMSLALVAVHRWPTSQAEYVEMGKYFGMFGAGLLVSIMAAYTLARFLPSIPYANQLVLAAPDEETGDAAGSLPPAQSPELLGAMGVAVTTLRPAGKARFGDEFIDVVAEGHYVEAGSRVQVIEIDGVRVVVKSV